MPKPTTQVLASTTALTNQTWVRSTLLRTGTHTLRATIRRNAYDHQSGAIIERWDGAAWRELATIPYAKMATCGTRTGNGGVSVPVVSYVREQLDAEAQAAFDTDQAELVRLARLVLD